MIDPVASGEVKNRTRAPHRSLDYGSGIPSLLSETVRVAFCQTVWLEDKLNPLIIKSHPARS